MLVNLSFEGFACPAVEIEESASVLQLKQTIELQTAVQIHEQELWSNNHVLGSDSASLQEAGVKHNDVIHVREKGKGTNSQHQEEQRIMDQMLSNPQLLQALPPQLRSGIQARDRGAISEVIQFLQAQQAAKQYEEIDALNADEFDPEAQAKIAERIRRENIEANMSAAYEHSPEVFGEINMLYVNLEVNGKPLKTFVDSGAQACVMSLRCAEQCNVAHLVDTRFQGILQGVGQQKMYGRIHSVSVKVGSEIVPMSVTVLEENEMDLLFGLDMLRRYRCNIDLENNCLRFGSLNVSLPFLPDHEIPKKRPHASAAAAGGPAAGGQPIATNLPKPSTSHQPTGLPGLPAASGPTEDLISRPQSSSQQEIGVTGGDSHTIAETYVGGDADNETKVTQLIGLGFTREMAEEALKACGGSIDHAASLLFSQ